jgi:Ser/Thr protein kinase RdoA (MazF antagonist)
VHTAELNYAEQILGPCELEQDLSWEHGQSVVLRLRDAAGASWIVKRHGDRDRHAAEVFAYRQWVPVLGSNAPRLRAVSDSLATVILSAVPGEPAPWPAADAGMLSEAARRAEVAQHRRAGNLLRRFHQARPPVPWENFGAAKVAEFNALAPLTSALLGKRELALARTQAEALTGLPCPGRVPCHRDYTPRNWVVSGTAQYVLDFELARLDVWLADLSRLHLGIWATRPDLQEAFLTGYGRQLSSTDHLILHGCAILTATWLLVKARQIRQRSLEDATHAALLRLLPASQPPPSGSRIHDDNRGQIT